MMLDSYISLIQREINTAFMNFLQRKYPEEVWEKTWYGQIVVNPGKDEVAEALEKSYQPIWVPPSEKQTRDGGVITVEGHWEKPKPMNSMDVAKMELRLEQGAASGYNIDAELAEFVEALSAGQISLGSMNFKG